MWYILKLNNLNADSIEGKTNWVSDFTRTALQKKCQLYSQMAAFQKKKSLALWGMLLLRAHISATNSCLHTPEENNQGHISTASQLLFLLAILSSMWDAQVHIRTTTSSWGSQDISNYTLADKICMVTTPRWSFKNQQKLPLSFERLPPLSSVSVTM